MALNQCVVLFFLIGSNTSKNAPIDTSFPMLDESMVLEMFNFVCRTLKLVVAMNCSA